ncbi:MAG: rhodanese-like domain-containing protein [Gammaproteobacteria bacterium]|nr:rhodanese-like domain-containing protein [Gammaproteobacteria bacterium]
MTQQIIQFISHHWLLCLGFIIVLGLIFFEEMRSKGLSGSQLNPQMATHLMNRNEATIVDTRANSAFSDGHIAGAINILEPDFERQLNKLKKHQNKTLILVDSNGQKAAQAAAKLRKQGFKTAVLKGGIQGWSHENLPLVKGKKSANGKD